MRQPVRQRYILMAVLFSACMVQAKPEKPLVASQFERSKPNFIIIFADDLGYGDLGCFGAPKIKTPHLDKMAKEGLRFTQFYAQTVCGPSRAALMTGCYPLRVAIDQNRVEVHPHLHTEEITIAEVLREAGYVSMALGKWDLAGHSQNGYSPALLPTHQGFNTFFGTPTSNDSVVNLLRDDAVIEEGADMGQLTRRYTDEAISFIQQNGGRPFFVYLAHTMPHVLLAASEPFKGKSAGGVYGDVVEEIDWNVGRILQTLAEEGLDDNTYLIFTSDNGPWYFGRSMGHRKRFGPDAVAHGGSASPLRGAKTSTWEGGLRVPCIVRAPGRVPAGEECAEVASTMDILPTFAKLAGGQVPADRVIDGHDITDLMHGVPGAKSPTQALYYYRRTQLEAVRSGKWKLYVPAPVDKQWANFSKAEDVLTITAPMLFDLDADVSETRDVALGHPEIVAQLLKHIEAARKDIGDHDRIGENARFFDPQPRRPDIDNSSQKKPMTKEKLRTREEDSPNSQEENGLLISDGSPFVPKDFYPKFSWEAPPQYFMFGDTSRVLLPEEVRSIAARTDFLCIEKSHGLRTFGAAELGAKHEAAAFKELKPNMKVLFYFNSAYAYPFTSYSKELTPDKIDQHPELKGFLLVDPETGNLARRGNTFYFDVLNPEFREWWSDTVAKGVEDSGCDGAFIDQMHGFSWLRADKSQEVQRAMGEMMDSLKSKMGPDKILLGNNANQAIAKHVFPVIDASMFEHYNDELLSKERLLQDWADMLRIAQAGKMSIFRIGVEQDRSPSRQGAPPGTQRGRSGGMAALAKERLEYYLACYLIGAQPYSYFQYGWGWTLSSGSLQDYPELHKPLGAPKGAYQRTTPEGWDFTREFEHASVWVNTESGQARITWR